MGKFNWYWLKSGQTANMDGKWLNGEPNNNGGREHCLCIGRRSEGVGFNDIECSGTELSGFICQDVTKVNNIDLRFGV